MSGNHWPSATACALVALQLAKLAFVATVSRLQTAASQMLYDGDPGRPICDAHGRWPATGAAGLITLISTGSTTGCC